MVTGQRVNMPSHGMPVHGLLNSRIFYQVVICFLKIFCEMYFYRVR